MPKLHDDDKLLVEGLILGDQYSFKILFDKYHGNLYRYSLKFLKSPELTKEAVHDVFVKIWEKRESINSELTFKHFLIKVCKNHLLNLLAKTARENSFKKEIRPFLQTSGNNTEEYFNMLECEGLLSKAITNLPPQRQMVFTMCKVEGKTYEEAATTLGISKGTVRDHMLKAGKAIKKFLSVYISLQLFLTIFN